MICDDVAVAGMRLNDYVHLLRVTVDGDRDDDDDGRTI